MAYTKNPTWVDGELGGTRIDAADLNHIEDGIQAAAATADQALAASGGAGSQPSPTDIVVGAPTGTNDHTLINTAIATAKTAGQPARLIFSPGTYVCSAALTSMAGTGFIEFVGGGSRRPADFTGGSVQTEIQYTGTGTGTFLDASDAAGFTVSGLGITYTSTSFTGTLIQAGGVTSHSYSPKFRDSYLGSTALATKTATILNLGKVVEASIEDTIIAGGAIGIDGTGSFSNAVTMTGGRFDNCTIAVKNPQFQWTFTGVVFEPGCVIKTVSANAEALAFHGCGWWDNTTNPWAWIDISGSGLSITGGYWEPQGGSGETLVKLNGAFDGLSITGLKGHGMNGSTGSALLTLASGASVTNLNYSGNSLTNCVDGIAAAQAVGQVIHSPKRATNEVRDLGNSGTAFTLPLVASAKLTLTGACTLALPSVPSGYEHTIRLLLLQDGTGSRTVTWPGAVRWPGGTAPTLTLTAAKADLFELSTPDGGTNWFGRTLGQNFTVSGATVTLPAAVAVYDASLLSLVNNDPVATWTDSSGNTRNATQGTTAARPTYIASAINSKPAVRFSSAATQYLYTPSTYALSTVFPAGTFSVIAVAKPDLTAGTAAVGGMDPNTGSARCWQMVTEWNAGAPRANTFAFASGGVSPAGDTQSITTAAAHVISAVRDTSTIQVWVDGTSDGSTAIGAVNTSGSSAIAIGSGGTQSGAADAITNGWVGDIAYLAIYPGVLTTAQRQSEEARLKGLYATP